MSFTSNHGCSLERRSILHDHEAQQAELSAGLALSVSSASESDSTLSRRRDGSSATKKQHVYQQSSENHVLLPPYSQRVTRQFSEALMTSDSSSAPLAPEPPGFTGLEAEDHFSVGLWRVHVIVGEAALSWKYVSSPQDLIMRSSRQVLFAETVAVRQLGPSSTWQCYQNCCGSAIPASQMHRVVIYSIRRRGRKRWGIRTLTLQTSSAEAAGKLCCGISAAADEARQRPRALLVFINPHGGARLAEHVWSTVAAPIFDLAGIACTVVTTQHADHCRSHLEAMTTAQLLQFDGVVAVGGDGFFQEALNAVITLRGGDDDRASAAARLRLGHVPAGSTDAVAYSFNGTRCQETAALHIALGDRMAIDVTRVDTSTGERRFSCCVAAYGYMGDLMAQSEWMRSFGPARYDLAGALTLFRGKSYKARVRWLPSTVESYTARRFCGANCKWCTSSASPRGPHPGTISGHDLPHDDVATRPKASAAAAAAAAREAVSRTPDNSRWAPEAQDGWREIEGDFAAIMAVTMPCRSDRSTLGLAPYAHMADGVIHLILVRKCSVLQYLQFLVSIPQRGVLPEHFEYVEGFDATAVTVEPIGKESSWSVDGELMSSNHISARIFRGLVDVFARGVES